MSGYAKIVCKVKVPDFTPTHAVCEKKWGMDTDNSKRLYTLDRVIALFCDEKMARLFSDHAFYILSKDATHEFCVTELPKKGR